MTSKTFQISWIFSAHSLLVKYNKSSLVEQQASRKNFFPCKFGHPSIHQQVDQSMKTNKHNYLWRNVWRQNAGTKPVMPKHEATKLWCRDSSKFREGMAHRSKRRLGRLRRVLADGCNLCLVILSKCLSWKRSSLRMGRLRPPQEIFEGRPEPSRVPRIGCNPTLPKFALFNPILTMHRTNEVYPGRSIFWRASPPGYTFKPAGLSTKKMTFTVKPGQERART